MTEFEKILEQCLIDLEGGVSNMAECLSRYPNHASQLEPVLVTHIALESVGAAQPSAAFKGRVRARLTQQMQAHPRKSNRFNFAFMRLAINFAIILMTFLLAGTAYAQRALPGEPFYEWKLASENAWRAVSSDPVATDLVIAERRMNELIVVSSNAVLHAQTLEAYLEVTTRLRSEVTATNEVLVLQTLDSQAEELNESGIVVPEVTDEDALPPIDEIVPTLVAPIRTLLPDTEIPQATTTPASVEITPDDSDVPVISTALPNVVNTVEAVPSIIPTIQVPPIVLPTIQLPDIIPTIRVPPLLP